mgnify:CR=1 FL=1
MTAMRRILLFLLALPQLQASATTYNVAPRARVTASSAMDEKHGANCVNDGIIRIADKGEWRSDAKMTFWGEIDFPWIQLDWEEEVEIGNVTLYDIATKDATCAGGELVFSDGSRLLVREIPAGGAPKVVSFAPKKTRSLRFEVTDGDGDHIGLSEIEVWAVPTDYVTTVDPYIETTRGRYFFFSTGSLPFGMISAAPLTRNKNQGGGGYNYNDAQILGFPQIHAWMLSGLVMMPTTGEGTTSDWQSPFTHAGEVVQPGYHRLFLERYQIWVEQTATDRASLYRLTFARNDDAHILLNLGGFVGTSTMVNAHITHHDNSSRLRRVFPTDASLIGAGDERCCWASRHNERVACASQDERRKMAAHRSYERLGLRGGKCLAGHLRPVARPSSPGYVNYGNQPGLSNAHVFAHAGRPDLTQKWVHRVRRQTYGGTSPDKGYGGHDEDQGQMASLSALMSLGLFAIDGGCSRFPVYDITAPLFNEITIRLHPDYCEGSEFCITTHNVGDENCYIQRMQLNGRNLDVPQLSHADFQRGGRLELWLDSLAVSHK